MELSKAVANHVTFDSTVCSTVGGVPTIVPDKRQMNYVPWHIGSAPSGTVADYHYTCAARSDIDHVIANNSPY